MNAKMITVAALKTVSTHLAHSNASAVTVSSYLRMAKSAFVSTNQSKCDILSFADNQHEPIRRLSRYYTDYTVIPLVWSALVILAQVEENSSLLPKMFEDEKFKMAL